MDFETAAFGPLLYLIKRELKVAKRHIPVASSSSYDV
jgi:hypothetical protein